MSSEDIVNHGRRIAELERKVSELYQRLGQAEPDHGGGGLTFASDQPASVAAAEDPRVLALIDTGQTIQAVKLYHELTSVGLPRRRTRSIGSHRCDLRRVEGDGGCNDHTNRDSGRAHDSHHRPQDFDRSRGNGARAAALVLALTAAPFSAADGGAKTKIVFKSLKSTGASGKLISHENKCEGGGRKVSLFRLDDFISVKIEITYSKSNGTWKTNKDLKDGEYFSKVDASPGCRYAVSKNETLK